ncbi:MAG: transporter substrate-binding domain-containing protein, partial [Cyclobacteriaceae bacterium]|nr:transporter substrate-binding domain-containing protein [Cyclobacteriaceae bacterium]
MAIFYFASLQEINGQRDTLTVCFLDLDMPLSQKVPDNINSLQGIYIDLAKLIAGKLGMELDPYFTMSAFHKRPVRAGLLSDNCRLQFGIPYTEGPEYITGKVTLTQPILQLGYALAVPASAMINNHRYLIGKKVGVQTGSPPQMALATMKNVQLVYFHSPEKALEALSLGSLDAAFIWGPVAGFQNKYLYENRFKVFPTTYEWPVAIGVGYEDLETKDMINQLIDELRPQINKLKGKYAFP